MFKTLCRCWVLCRVLSTMSVLPTYVVFAISRTCSKFREWLRQILTISIGSCVENNRSRQMARFVPEHGLSFDLQEVNIHDLQKFFRISISSGGGLYAVR